MTGTSIKTPTTVASAAPELNPNKAIAAATANSKKLLAPISAEGPATQCGDPTFRFSQYASPELIPNTTKMIYYTIDQLEK